MLDRIMCNILYTQLYKYICLYQNRIKHLNKQNITKNINSKANRLLLLIS